MLGMARDGVASVKYSDNSAGMEPVQLSRRIYATSAGIDAADGPV